MKSEKLYYLRITSMNANVPTDRLLDYGDTEIGHTYEVLDLNKERVLLLHAKNNDENADQAVGALLTGSHVILMNSIEGQESVENKFNCSVVAHADEIAQVYISEFHTLLNEVTCIDSRGVNLDYYGLNFPGANKLVHELLRDKKIIIRSAGRAEKITQCHQMFEEMEVRGAQFDAQLSGLPVVQESAEEERMVYFDDNPHLSIDEALTVLSETFCDHGHDFNIIGVSDDVVA